MYNKNSSHPYFYSAEQLDWLWANLGSHINTVSLTKEFNETFGTHKTHLNIKSIVRRNFPEHRWPFSGGRKKGTGTSVTASHVGAERYSGGYWYVKIDNKPLPKNFTTEDVRQNWVQKHRHIWEMQHGKLDRDKVVVFLDGNRSNFDISNLYAVSRVASIYMVRNQWFSEDPIMTMTAIRFAELQCALKTDYRAMFTERSRTC